MARSLWDDIKQKLRRTEGYRKLLGEIGSKGEASVAGLVGSSRSLLVSTVVGDDAAPVFVLVPDQVTLEDVVEDLGLFGVEGVVGFYEEEVLPYDYHEPDMDIVGLQMSALNALRTGKAGVVVATVRSLMKKVIPPGLLSSLVTELRLGTEMDIYELVEKLIDMGYERHNIVEEKGQFAVRGGIFDIYEVTGDMPVRLEFDGDEIVSMRSFDVETQKSTSSRETLTIHPARNFVVSQQGVEDLREWLEGRGKRLQEEELERARLVVERFERGISFFGMENYAPFFTELVPLYEYLESTPIVFVFGYEACTKGIDEYSEDVRERFDRSISQGSIYPEPEKLYLGRDEVAGWIEEEKTVKVYDLISGGAIRFSTSQPGDYRRNLKALERDIRKELTRGRRVFFFCSNEIQRGRVEELLGDVSIEVDFPVGNLSSGFRWEELGVLFLSEDEVFGRYKRAIRLRRSKKRSLTYDPSQFQPGDFVVHINHGIGRYMGLRIIDVDGGRTECLDIRYEGDDHLFIPVNQLRLIEKYVSSEGAVPGLDRLGSTSWAKRKEKARKSAGLIAKDLLEIYAARQLARGYAFEPDKPWQKEMEASFPYEETPHQIHATEEVKADMEKPKPMDRLLCGDVGFGKTEVAIRAAFKAVLSGKQCAFLVPTTVLALQHYRTLTDRLKGYPVNVAMLSRFVTRAEQKKILAGIADGSIDIVVGTHRLISKDVKFADLGLLIIDEEHRFGVRQKEALKKLKKSVDVLSMTATPIPRTLSMALSGIRDLSVIDTPPRNRLPIHTEIIPFDDDEIRDAIMREIQRGGQVFFVHNRVQSIKVMEGYLKRLLPPGVKVATAHGQMPERELERRMIDFLERKFDVLVCTMIIEAGLDFQNVNTIIINRAERFGLAQLYQLRGRVGRSDRKAYAYLIVPSSGALTSEAMMRLQAISEFDYLGAGYHIAVRDLEIRGAGNLLGPEQSGHISAVGLDLYTRMLREEVSKLKGEPVEEVKEVRLSVPVPAYIPADYVSDSEERMDIYRRLSRVVDLKEVDEVATELVDRFGPLPVQAELMLRLVGVRLRASRLGIKKVESNARGRLNVVFEEGYRPQRRLIAGLASEYSGMISFNVRKGFSIEIDFARESGGLSGRSGTGHAAREQIVEKIENLLKLLEFYAN